MTPLSRESAQPLLLRTKQREQDLCEKMMAEETTPEEHGEYLALSYFQFELSLRLRMQEKGKIQEGWVQGFIDEMKTWEREHPPNNRGRSAEKHCIFALAEELALLITE